MEHKEAKGAMLKEIIKLAHGAMGQKVKGRKPVAMEVEVTTAIPAGKDDKESRKKKLRELLKGG